MTQTDRDTPEPRAAGVVGTSYDDIGYEPDRDTPVTALRELLAVEQAAAAWVAAHPARKDSCTIWDCPTATRLRAAVDAAAAAVNERVRAALAATTEDQP